MGSQSERSSRVRSFLGTAGTVWAVVGVFLLFIALLELGGRALFPADDPEPAWRTSLREVDNGSWFEQLLAETREVETEARWHPYVGWQAGPRNGALITVDETGARKTWRKASLPGDAPGVLFLGGSSMWGLGVRDDHTIPSLVTRGLAERGVAVDGINRAQLGYVSTQSLLTLILELRNGKVPDVVVMYDGFNDSAAACQVGDAGGLLSAGNRRREFNLLKRPLQMLGMGTRELLEGSVIGRIAYRISGSSNRDTNVDPCLRWTGPEGESLADEVTGMYQETVRQARALSREYGFDLLVYRQPTVAAKAIRTPGEQRHHEAMRALLRFHDMVEKRLRESGTVRGLGIDGLDEAFVGVAAPVFIDACHLGEQGNALVAERIIANLIPVLAEGNDEP
jgi:hypothetical protein